MAYDEIFQNIHSLLINDQQLIPGILGPRTPTNMRLMRAWPQMQQFFLTYEPNQPSEGWIVIEEPAPGIRASAEQFTTNHQWLEILFHVYGTTYALTHAALDVLDHYFHWEVEQQRDVKWGNRFLLFTRRYMDADKYAQDVKLYEKQCSFRMEFALEESPV